MKVTTSLSFSRSRLGLFERFSLFPLVEFGCKIEGLLTFGRLEEPLGFLSVVSADGGSADELFIDC